MKKIVIAVLVVLFVLGGIWFINNLEKCTTCGTLAIDGVNFLGNFFCKECATLGYFN